MPTHAGTVEKDVRPATRFRGALAAVIVLAFVLRLLWVFLVPNHPVSDFMQYHRIAEALSVGEESPQYGIQGMGYPKILSAVYRVFPSHHIIAAKLFNVVVSTLTLLVIASFLAWAGFPHIVPLLLVIAIFPQCIAYCSILGTEILATFLLAWIVLLQIAPGDPRWRYPAIGAFWGILTLVRPMFLLYPPVIVAAERLQGNGWKTIGRRSLAIFSVGALVLLPWAARALFTKGTLLPISYNSGLVLFASNNENNVLGRYMDPELGYVPVEHKKIEPNAQPTGDAQTREDRQDSFYRRVAAGWIASHPIEFVKLGILRLYNAYFAGAPDLTWATNDLDSEALSRSAARSVNLFRLGSGMILGILIAINLVLLAGMTGPILRSLRQGRALDPRLAIPCVHFAFITAVCFLLEGQPRYSVPFLFLLILGAAQCCDLFHFGLKSRLRERREPE